jgi:hypothetical protein
MVFFFLPLSLMKKNKLILSLSLAVAVLISIVFQSFHTYEHLEKQLSEKQCHHKYNSKSEITHQHHNLDHCYVCEFTFGTYISPNNFSSQLNASYKKTPCFLIATEVVISFSGSLYSHRGPPVNS